jgi:hypothetical protein
VQTVSVPPGDTTIVEMEILVPWTYTLVDHAIFRLEKGPLGIQTFRANQGQIYTKVPSHRLLVLDVSCTLE